MDENTITKTEIEKTVLRCSFCNKSQDDVRKLIAAEKLFICDECIAFCNHLIENDIEETDVSALAMKAWKKTDELWKPVRRALEKESDEDVLSSLRGFFNAVGASKAMLAMQFIRPHTNSDTGKPKDSLLKCSFCNKSQNDVRKLIAGPTVFICDECVGVCNDIIAEDETDAAPGDAKLACSAISADADQFDGFITPDGQRVSIHDVETMFQFFVAKNDSPDRIKEALVVCAAECRKGGHFNTACGYLEKAVSLELAASERAELFLEIGQVREIADDYKAALSSYTRAFDELPQEQNDVWYFLNNNRAYCLNKESRHMEAETHCRTAIAINAELHNAHKNLGIALGGQGRYVEAARSFACANRLCPADGRALGLLRSLAVTHPEVLEEDPDLLTTFGDGTTKPIASC